MVKLVLLRHGESLANQQNTYTGWSDVPLTSKGRAEAVAAGEKIDALQLSFTMAHTSLLKRAILTTYLVLETAQQDYLPIQKDWRLNERHYGDLRGLNKNITREIFGKDQVALWRRSYTQVPPLLLSPDLARPYQFLPIRSLPRGESLKMALQRLLPYWQEQLAPRLRAGENQLLVAHGSTLRALVKYLEQVSDEDINQVEIANGVPIVYEFDEQLKVIDKQTL